MKASDDAAISGPLAQYKHVILAIVVALWLIATAVGLWWFQSQTIRPFLPQDQPPPAANTVQQQLTEWLQQHDAGGQAPVTLLHFWNPDCLCNQVSKRHFDGLLASTTEQQLRIIVVAPAITDAKTLEEFRRLNSPRLQLVQLQADDFAPVASPSLALLSRDSSAPSGYRLGYYGAYGFGALCSVASDDFFPNIVRKMTEGAYGPFLNVAGSGCFCEWPTQPLGD